MHNDNKPARLLACTVGGLWIDLDREAFDTAIIAMRTGKRIWAGHLVPRGSHRAYYNLIGTITAVVETSEGRLAFCLCGPYS